MSKHRLTEDFYGSDLVRFIGINGDLWDSSRRDAIASVGRKIQIGEPWGRGEA